MWQDKWPTSIAVCYNPSEFPPYLQIHIRHRRGIYLLIATTDSTSIEIVCHPNFRRQRQFLL